MQFLSVLGWLNSSLTSTVFTLHLTILIITKKTLIDMKFVLKFKSISKGNIFDIMLHLVVQCVNNTFHGGNLVFVPSSDQSELLLKQIQM